MIPDPLHERAMALKLATQELQIGLASGDPDQMSAALDSRLRAFESLVAIPLERVSDRASQVVGEILELDRQVMEQCRSGMDQIREELSQVRHAREVVTRQNRSDEGPRFVSRRA